MADNKKELPCEDYVELFDESVKHYLMGMFNQEINDNYYITELVPIAGGKKWLVKLTKNLVCLKPGKKEAADEKPA